MKLNFILVGAVALGLAAIIIVVRRGAVDGPNRAPEAVRSHDSAASTGESTRRGSNRWVAGADEHARRRDFTTALAMADSAVSADPADADAHFVRGRILFDMLRLEESRDAFLRVIELAEDYVGVRHNLGNIAFRRNRMRDALNYYLEEGRRFPAGRPWHAAGGVYSKLGVPDSARRAYDMARSIEPGYAPASEALAEWFHLHGDHNEALRLIREARRLDPGNLQFAYREGVILLDDGRVDESVSVLMPVVESRPWDYSAVFALGRALQQDGQPDQAARYLERAGELREIQAAVDRLHGKLIDFPNDFTARMEVGDILRKTGRLDEALAAYQGALTLQPANLPLRNNIATLQLSLGDTAAALAGYEDVIRRDSSFVEAWLNLAVHFARTGDRHRADQAWERALEIDPDHPMVQRIRGQ